MAAMTPRHVRASTHRSIPTKERNPAPLHTLCTQLDPFTVRTPQPAAGIRPTHQKLSMHQHPAHNLGLHAACHATEQCAASGAAHTANANVVCCCGPMADPAEAQPTPTLSFLPTLLLHPSSSDMLGGCCHALAAQHSTPVVLSNSEQASQKQTCRCTSQCYSPLMRAWNAFPAALGTNREHCAAHGTGKVLWAV